MAQRGEVSWPRSHSLSVCLRAKDGNPWSLGCRTLDLTPVISLAVPTSEETWLCWVSPSSPRTESTPPEARGRGGSRGAGRAGLPARRAVTRGLPPPPRRPRAGVRFQRGDGRSPRAASRGRKEASGGSGVLGRGPGSAAEGARLASPGPGARRACATDGDAPELRRRLRPE